MTEFMLTTAVYRIPKLCVHIWILANLFFSTTGFSQTSSDNKSRYQGQPDVMVLWGNEAFGKYDPTKEIVEKRDAHSKHFRNEDGSITAHVAAGDINYFQDGQWRTIFHTISPTSNGFENVSNLHKTYYPATASGSLTTVLPKGGVLKDMNNMRMYYELDGQKFGVQNIRNSSGSVKFNELTYLNVYGEGIDLKFTHNTNIRKMDYILQNKSVLSPAPANAQFLVMEETVELQKGWEARLVDNVIFLYDQSGNLQAVYEKPLCEDTQTHEFCGNLSEEEHEHAHNKEQRFEAKFEISQQNNLLVIKTKVSMEWLLSEERQFPLTIDPTLNCYPTNAAYWTGTHQTDCSCAGGCACTTSNLAGSYTYTNTYIFANHNDNIYVGRYAATDVFQAWSKFDITSIPDGSAINSAALYYNVLSSDAAQSDCIANVYLRHMNSDPSFDFSNGTNNQTRLADIRDGDIYETRNFGGNVNGTTGTKSTNLSSNLNHLQSQLVANWFAVGFHTFAGANGHTTCYMRIYGYSHANKPYLSITYTPCAVGNPADFGTDQWNVYAYNGGDLNLSGSYAGYYVETALSYNTLNRWGDGSTPSAASGYLGCTVGIDNHVVVSKRRGFPCGKYQLDMPNHDDDARVYVDGVLVWSHEPGCCDAHTNIWTGYLSTNSTIEVRHLEGVGGSHQSLTLTNVTPTITSGTLSVNGTAGNITICQGSTVTVTQSGGSYTDATYCYWIGTNNGTGWVNSWDIWNGANCGTNTPPTTPVFNSPGSYVFHTNGYNNVCGWLYAGGGGTRIVTVIPAMGPLQTEAISAGTCGGSTTLNVNNITGKGEKLNYSTWTVGSGSATGFNQNGATAENQRVNGTDPWGNTRVIWEAVSTGTNNDDGGWNTPTFPIDNTKLYRFSVWIKRSNIGNGYAYLGAYGFDAGGNNTGLINISNGANDGNPYFWYGDQSQFVQDQWVLIVGHIYPHTHTGNTVHPQSGRYTVAGGYQATIGDYKWRPESVSSLHRTYLYYSTDPNTRQQFAYPRVDVVDGTEPTIAQLIGGFDANAGLPIGATWTWYQGGCGVGSPIGTGASITVSPSATTDYYVRAVGGTCASSSCKNLTVTVNQPPVTPTITPGSATTFCEGSSVNLTATSSLAGNAISLNGSQSISIGNPPELQITKNSTIEMWIYPTNFSERRNPYDKAYAGEGTITQETDGTLSYFYGNNGDNGPGGTYLGFSSATPVTINQWNHIAIVRDITNNEMRWYINGVLTNTGTPTFNPISGTNPVTLGLGYTGYGFIGQMDEVRVWNVARTTAEIQNNRTTTIAPGQTGLVGYWRFDESSGTSVYDASGFSTTGTLISSPTRVIPSTAPIYPTYTWSPASGLNSTTGAAVTATPTSSVTYTVSAVSPHGCGNSTNTQAITVNTNSTAPTAVTGGGSFCHGNSTVLNSTGGSLGTDAVDVWYKGSCNEAYTQRWNAAPGAYANTTVNSVNSGILNLTSTSNDPMINMYGLGSFDPATYRYINVRYRVTSATAAVSMQFFWTNGLYGAANGGQSRTQAISSTQNVWQVVSIDMANTALGPGDWYHSNVTGWRFDWATVSGVTMEVDFITLSQHPMVALGASLPLAPTQTDTYYTKKIGTCNSTTCNSATITLPTVGTVLAGDGTRTATCNVSGNNWVHFYDNGELIVSVNANGGNLGSVTATSYVEANDNAILTQACNTGSNPQWTTAALGRRWKITPTVNTSALLRFPFETGEFSKLVTASTTGTPSNPFDNVTTISNLKMSHYSGGVSQLNVNGSWADNCISAGGAAGTQLVPNQTAVPVGNDVNTTNGFMATVSNGKFVQFTTPGFSEFWLHNAANPSALPVELTNFSANCNANNEVLIQWTTASEHHSQKFMIEKSRDLVNWIFVSEYQAAGNSNHNIDYEAIDQNPYEGNSYYRLIQVDLDGTENIYDPISVSCSGNDNTLTVFPNPTDGSFTVEITSTEDLLNAEVQLVDITGKLVSFRKVNIVEGKNQLFFNESDLQMGTYFVRFIAAEKFSNTIQFKPVKVVLN